MFVGDDTVYLIALGRGYEQGHSVLGAGLAGVLERDGFDWLFDWWRTIDAWVAEQT